MIKLECNKSSVKMLLCGNPIELMSEMCVISNAITKRVFKDCPKRTLDAISGTFIEEITSAMTSAIDEIKEGSDE